MKLYYKFKKRFNPNSVRKLNLLRRRRFRRESKRWWEVILIPLAIALVGTIGTYFITNQQIKSSELISNTQRESAEKLAKSDQQIKLLEIFFNKITSSDKNERQSALIILKNLDQELAIKLAKVLLETPSQDPIVRQTAENIIEQFKGITIELCEGKEAKTVTISGDDLLISISESWPKNSRMSFKIDNTRKSVITYPLGKGDTQTVFDRYTVFVIAVHDGCATLTLNERKE